MLVTIDMCQDCGGLWLDAGEFGQIKAVREGLKQAGKLEEPAPASGIKASLLHLINNTMDELKFW